MKNIKFLFSLLALLSFISVSLTAGGSNPGTSQKSTSLKVDTKKSVVKWEGKKVTGQHNGTINIADGTLTVENNKLTGGQFAMDMNSITNEDLTDASYNAKLVGHLKSDDFFSSEKHPKATFKITKVTPIANAKDGENNYEITGDLTIKGITNSVSFPANVKIAGNKAEAVATVVVDRTKWDVRYGSGKFFEGLGDKMIYDDFTLNVKLVAGK